MDEVEMLRQVKKAKRWNCFFLACLGIILIIILCALIVYKYQHTFSVQRWINYPNERIQIVDDMLKKNNLVGMSVEEVKALLGEETHEGKQSSFKLDNEQIDPGTSLVYYLGVNYMDGVWLVIPYRDNIITGYSVLRYPQGQHQPYC